MKSPLTLCIETSTRTGGVALGRNGKILEKFLPRESAHARSLVPCIQSLLEEMEAAPSEIRLVVVGVGPGSYTGLRVGVATALALAQEAKAGLVGISSLTAIAKNAPANGSITVLSNAFGGELYLSLFEKKDSEVHPTSPIHLVPALEIGRFLPHPTFLLGDGIAKIATKDLPPGVTLAGPELWEPLPSTVLRLGQASFEKEGSQDPRTVRPLYLRPSRAEILHDQRQRKGEK